LGQARWGSLRSWQLGHSESPAAEMASWARRVEVRRLEWRRFGFGITDSFQLPVRSGQYGRGGAQVRQKPGELCVTVPNGTSVGNGLFVAGAEPAAQIGQSGPARVGGGFLAGAGFGVAIASAAGAEPFAVLAAKGSCGEGEQHLLAQNVFENQSFSLIITDFGVGRGEGALGGASVGAEGSEEEIEVAQEGVADGFEAAGAGDFEVAVPAGAGADVLDDFFGAAVLAEELGVALDGEGGDLAGLAAEVDGARGDAGIEGDGLALKVEQGDQHGGLLCAGRDGERGLCLF